MKRKKGGRDRRKYLHTNLPLRKRIRGGIQLLKTAFGVEVGWDEKEKGQGVKGIVYRGERLASKIGGKRL